MGSIVKTDVNNLPQINDISSKYLETITNALGVPREVLVSDYEINYSWKELPREISRIPNEYRGELIVRMCIAISVGLFDGAINYIWNAVILNFRKRILDLGLENIAKFLNKEFTEEKIKEMTDAELLDLVYKFNIISDEGFYFLNQCRDMRNNFSSAHPAIARIDDRELINFISRCCKYGLSENNNFKGINIKEFVNVLKGDDVSADILIELKNKVNETYPAQREMLLGMMLGIYCDSTSKESARINALKISQSVTLEERTICSLMKQYNENRFNNDAKKGEASRIFIEKIGLINYLSDPEKFAIIEKACKRLRKVHLDFNNFYNEVPMAERLNEITQSLEIPESLKYFYVNCVLMCYIGNEYGVSNCSIEYYENMIKNFKPKEIEIMLNIDKADDIIITRLKRSASCRKRYVESLKLLNLASLTPLQTSNYNELLKKYDR